MAESLGEKLRQAREARGITISEVAEQTRISTSYLEGIEADDYRALPGGIFNKGFVKSYAKYVGVDEQEALQDYMRLTASQTNQVEEEPKTYRPEVLTDDRSTSSLLPTIIFAIIILGLMTWGILALVSYLNSRPTNEIAATPTPATINSNSAPLASVNANTNSNQTLPAIDQIKVEFKPLSETVSVQATIDGKIESDSINAQEAKNYTANQSLSLSYYRGFADKVQLTVNGKQIAPPAAPPRGNTVNFEINRNNINQILQSGKISTDDAAN